MEQDKKEPHNLHTKPVENADKDKLRENPHNDERIIYQKEEPGPDANPDLRSGSTFAEKDEGRNRVTNEQEQDQVVNPGVSDVQEKGKE